MAINKRGNCVSCASLKIKSAGVSVPYWGFAPTPYPVATEPFWCNFGLFKDLYGEPGPNYHLLFSVVDNITGKLSVSDPAYATYDGSYQMYLPFDTGNLPYHSGNTPNDEVLGRAKSLLDKYNLNDLAWGDHVRLSHTSDAPDPSVSPAYKGAINVTAVETWIHGGASIPIDLLPPPNQGRFWTSTQIVGGFNGFFFAKMQIQTFGYAKACIQFFRAPYGVCNGDDVWKKSVLPCVDSQGETITTDIVFPDFTATMIWLNECAQCTKKLPAQCY